MTIPTGVKTVTATTGRRNFLLYKCEKCVKTVLAPYDIHASGYSTYHVFMKKRTKERSGLTAQEYAVRCLDEYDEMLLKAINNEKRYKVIELKIVCPHCQKQQSWSGTPVKWTKAPSFRLWLVGMVFSGVIGLCGCLVGGPFLLILPALMVIPPIHRTRKRNKHRAEMPPAHYSAPTYYNKSNIQELAKGPYGGLLLPYLNQQAPSI